MAAFPTRARAVVVGGGIMGCSTAYHLAKMGWKDVVLLERAQLTSGSTWHAAGLVGQLRSSATITQLLGHSVALYESLEAETGQATGWKMTGGLKLACTEERMTELKRSATTARSFGLEMDLITPSEAQKLFPLMEIGDVVGAAFIPTDGSASPSDITAALAKGARMHGAQIIEECPVTSVEQKNGRVTAVICEQGRIECDYVVNCCGQWGSDFGRLAGVRIPLVAVQHQFMVTQRIEGVSADWPTLRDPDRLTYYKEEGGGLIMGGYERDPIRWKVDRIPRDFTFQLLEPDFDHFQDLANLAMPRIPALQTVGVQKLVNGPEAFTPDGYFILGEAPELKNYYVGAGFNAFGIAAAGGAGKALAEWMMAGEPPYDLWRCDIRRFARHHEDPGWVRARTLELYGKHYTIPWPFEEHDSGRPLRRSPLYDTLLAAGACFGEKMGWERPNWFAPKGVEAKDVYSFGRQNWFEHVGNEHRAVRERVGVFDQTSFAKFMVIGKDAEKALSWICANDISGPTGRLTYTQMLNSRGGIECDVTVARLAEDRFYITTGTAFGTHDTHWIASNIREGLDAHLVDMTSAHTVLGVMGPRSREVLTALSDDDLSNESFPFATVRRIHVAGAPVMALRVTFVGELGWELHVPTEFAKTVHAALMRAGAAHDIVNAGYRAIDSMRLEKGYRLWGVDITPDHTPLEAGLGWATKLKTEIPFVGREALVEQKRVGVKKLLACFTVDDPDTIILGRETIFRNGERVGWLTSGGWGYTLEKNIGFGYVRCGDGVNRAHVLEGSYELEVACERVAAQVHLDSLYDPKMQRIKA